MYKLKPWLRFMAAPEDGSGAAADGVGAGGGTGAGAPPPADDPEGSGATPVPDKPDADEFKSEHSKSAVLADLRSERDARKALEDRIREYEERDLTDSQKAQRDAEAERNRLAEVERDASGQRKRADQLEAALEKGLPKSWATRLQGETLDELLADAESVAGDLQSRDTRETPGAGARGDDGLAPTSPGLGSLRAAYSTTT